MMSSNFGYGSGSSSTSSGSNLDANVQYIGSKIDSIKLHFQDLHDYFQKNKEDIDNGTN